MNEKIYVQIGNEKKEAIGKILEYILESQIELQAQENRITEEQKAKQATLDSAIAKLAKLGLTEDEAKAIIGIQ